MLLRGSGTAPARRPEGFGPRRAAHAPTGGRVAVPRAAASPSSQAPSQAPAGQPYYQETPLQDAITGMASWDAFVATVQSDSTLHQDLLSFVAQPWVDRPWYRANTCPAVAAMFSDPAQAGALQDFRDVIGAIDRSLTPEQAAWFAIPYLRDVSVAPTIYTAMTNLTSVVFDDDAVAGLEAAVDSLATPDRVARLWKAFKAAMAAPVPPEVAAATPDGGNPVASGAFTGFQAYWTKARRAKYLDVYDEVQTDEHYRHVSAFMHDALLPLLNGPQFGEFLSALDAALPQARLERLAGGFGALMGGTWGLAVAERLDSALPKERVLKLLLALDGAANAERLGRASLVLANLGAAFTPERTERAFVALELLLEGGRAARFGALIDAATSDPERLERYTALAERVLTEGAFGRLLDGAGAVLASPERTAKAAAALDAAWGDPEKLGRWLGAVDTLNAGADGRGTKLLAVADLLAEPKGDAATGLPNLSRVLGRALGGGRLLSALDSASPGDLSRLGAALGGVPAVLSLVDALLPGGAVVRLVRALDAVFENEWAQEEAERMAGAALQAGSGGGSTAVLAGAGRLMWAAHGAMLRQLFAGA